MIKVNVSITNISAERFWDIRKSAPNIQISTNINVVSIDKKPDDSLDIPFVLTINYSPSVAQMSLKGSAYVQGDIAEIEQIRREYDQKKPPPQVVLQSISNVVFTESILVSRILNIPPPIPLPLIPDAKESTNSKASPRDYSS